MTFGNNNEGVVIGKDIIGKSGIEIENVFLVKGLKHNFLNISQLCDKCYYVKFE